MFGGALRGAVTAIKKWISDQMSGSSCVVGIAQAVINRMAANSASCKAWCITLVAAILVIVADKGQPNFALIAGIPAVLFLALDTHYLALKNASEPHIAHSLSRFTRAAWSRRTCMR